MESPHHPLLRKFTPCPSLHPPTQPDQCPGPLVQGPREPAPAPGVCTLWASCFLACEVGTECRLPVV